MAPDDRRYPRLWAKDAHGYLVAIPVNVAPRLLPSQRYIAPPQSQVHHFAKLGLSLPTTQNESPTQVKHHRDLKEVKCKAMVPTSPISPRDEGNVVARREGPVRNSNPPALHPEGQNGPLLGNREHGHPERGPPENEKSMANNLGQSPPGTDVSTSSASVEKAHPQVVETNNKKWPSIVPFKKRFKQQMMNRQAVHGEKNSPCAQVGPSPSAPFVTPNMSSSLSPATPSLSSPDSGASSTPTSTPPLPVLRPLPATPETRLENEASVAYAPQQAARSLPQIAQTPPSTAGTSQEAGQTASWYQGEVVGMSSDTHVSVAPTSSEAVSHSQGGPAQMEPKRKRRRTACRKWTTIEDELLLVALQMKEKPSALPPQFPNRTPSAVMQRYYKIRDRYADQYRVVQEF